VKRSLLTSTTLIATFIVATTACAQPNPANVSSSHTSQNVASQNIARTQAAGTVSHSVDKRLRQILKQAGIKTQITSIVPSNFPNMYQVNLVGQLPLHMTADGKYVIQGKLQKNPSKRVVSNMAQRSHRAQIGQPISPALKSALLANMSALKNMNTKTPFFYTAVPGVIWGATLEGVPFLLSDDAQYITDGEISVIENGQFVGLDTEFEQRKNQSVFATLDDEQLITYPATSPERAVIYVADDVNCPYCRRLHQRLPMLNAKGVTVNIIGYPIYEQSPAQMRGIWCQGDEDSRRKAFDKAMLQGEMTPAPASCNIDLITPNRDKAAGLAVMATPAIYREDGVLYQASFESPEFLEFLGVE